MLGSQPGLKTDLGIIENQMARYVDLMLYVGNEYAKKKSLSLRL